MRCPYCRNQDTKVLETREAEGVTRRRRECLKCAKRFTTHEQVEIVNLFIIKKDGRREQFNREKLISGVMSACQKRPISLQQVEELATEIETRLLNHKNTEVKSAHIGELVMRRLKKLDNVAYIRFASVYRDFEDIDSFQDELKQLLTQGTKTKKISG